jgi:tetratricopeptide (TPR) repeat protein
MFAALFAAGALVCLLVARNMPSDTIVLKNGKRIFALSVSQDGDKISYETSAGTLTIPRSMVDHVERAGENVAKAGEAAGFSLKHEAEAAAETLSPNRTEIEKRVVQNDEVDRDYIARLEGEARGGRTVENQNAAMAHHAASQFELQHGEMDLALADARTALTYSPEHPVLLLDVAYLYLRRSEYRQSLDYLERARRTAPDDPEVSKLAGWAYYGLNKMDQAVVEWKRAQSLRPDAEVEAALKKAERDKQEEEQYRENESSHFTLRYSGASDPALAREVLRTLEKHFGAIESELNYTPPNSIGVILYTQQTFADITSAPNWVGALNDGRIRVPVQGLNEVTPDLSRVLKHELTHSFIQQKTRGHAPTWIQEGFAQWMEGKRSGQNAPALILMYQKDRALVSRHFGDDWMKLPGSDASVAYAWALANIEYIAAAGGAIDVDRILDRLAAGTEPEAAVNAILHSDYEGLSGDTVAYLRNTYAN